MFAWEFPPELSELRMSRQGALQPILLIRCRLSGNKTISGHQYLTDKCYCSSETVRDEGCGHSGIVRFPQVE